jgi:Xaa-Pro aminopeptidase
MSDRIRSLFLIAILLPALALAAAGPSEGPYAARRTALIAKVGAGIILIPSQIQGPRGGAVQDNKDFIYLTGAAEPDALLVLGAGSDKGAILFNRSGKWRGPAETALETKVLTEARSILFRQIGDAKVALPFSGLDAVLTAAGGSAALSGAAQLVNIDPALAEMRIVKDDSEIETIQRAVDLTAAAYIEALKAARPGRTELDVNAVFEYVYARKQASSSFTQIASGPNSVNIHFGATGRVLAVGDLIVFDLGAWVDGYTSDISRTVPVGGRFSPEQAALYNVVLSAQKEGIRLMTAGNGVQKTQTAVEDALLAGLQKLGLVTDPASPWQRRLYIQHGFTHGIGLDVHDVWGWFARRMRAGLVFEPGMVLTMEPGLYFPAGRLDKYPGEMKSMVSEADWAAFAAKAGPVYKKYENMGCRIEDDVLVTATGNRVLTAGAPKEIAEIEKTMKGTSPFLQIK